VSAEREAAREECLFALSARKDERVERELKRAQQAQSTPGALAFGTLTGIGLVSALEWVRHPGPIIVIWAVVHVLLITPYLIRETWARQQKIDDLGSWHAWWRATFLASSIMWGLEALVFFDVNDPLWTALRLVFFAGLGVVSVAAFAADFSFLRLAALTALPQAAVMFKTGDPVHLVMASGLLIYMALCVVVTLQLNGLLRRSAELRFRSEDAYLSKARFLAAASHDLRQPLHALSLFVELLAARVTDPKQREFVDRIDLSSRALGGLLNALLDLSRVDAGALKPKLTHFKLATLLHELEGEVAAPAARKGLQVQVKPTSLVVHSDVELLGRILRNLLANALRYTPKGTVTLEAREERGKVLISVADTGLGIPPEAQEKVFEEFYQVGNPERDREQGLGLGLSIVRGICRTLEYPVKLISQPQRPMGSEFLVEVPAGEPSQVQEPQPVRASADPGFGGRRVLIIDDEKDVRDAMTALLESWNCKPFTAGSLSEASALLTTQPLPDAVVCDYRLPDNITGAMAIAALEQLVGKKLPTLLVTGDTSAERIREMKQAGHPVLFKPAQPGKLRAALSAILNRPS
jgi:two-component system, sensor histidine kinase